MPWWSSFLIALALIISFPFIRFLFKRISLLFKVKSFCKKQGVILHKTSTFWYLGVRNGGGCNFYMETPNKIYSVKLFPTLKKQSCVRFLDNRRYYIEKFMVLFGSWGASVKFSFKSRVKKLNEINFKHKFNTEWNAKPLVPVLLINPICEKVQLKNGDTNQIICDGDTVFETYVFGLKGLIKEIIKDIKR